ncbi:hypothetical protein O0536_25385, partial [Brevibacillus laterosporus]|uniref:hypothetical protein n=1 Tax=Brevibacillus laterosporus TaxID=1465 RepID=UPI0022A79D7E
HERSEAIVLDSKTSAPIDGTYPDITRIIPKAYCAEYAIGGESLDKQKTAYEIIVKVGGKKSPYASIAVTSSGLTFTTICGIGVY